MSKESTGWTGGQRAFGDFRARLVHYTDRVLFDEVWERPGLFKRDRSLITVAALLAGGYTEQLNFHLEFARRTAPRSRSSSRRSPTWPSTPAGPKRCPRWPSRRSSSPEPAQRT